MSFTRSVNLSSIEYTLHALGDTLTYNICYDCARDLISFQVAQEYESNKENEKNFENHLIIMTVVH